MKKGKRSREWLLEHLGLREDGRMLEDLQLLPRPDQTADHPDGFTFSLLSQSIPTPPQWWDVAWKSSELSSQVTNVIKKFLFIKTLTLTIAQIRVALMVVQARAALLTILQRRCSIFQILINTIFYRYQYFLKSSSRMSLSIFSRIVFSISISIFFKFSF